MLEHNWTPDEPGLDLDAVLARYLSAFGPSEITDRLTEIDALLAVMVASGDHSLWEPAGQDSPLWRIVRRTAQDALNRLSQEDTLGSQGEI
jgi:hypothetical protein